MKKSLLLIVSLMVSSFAVADENSLLQAKLRAVDRRGEGRSLRDILDQHGGQLKPGSVVITVDGVLEDESPASVAMAKLKRRATEFKLVRDERLLKVLVVLSCNRSNDPSTVLRASGGDVNQYSENVNILLGYIEVAYGQERSPLVAFIADVIREKQEAATLTTDALRLLSDRNCRTGASEVMRLAGEYTQVLLIIEKVLEQIWQEIKPL